jgi:phosphohistidine swiveling domain-containing protein
VIARELGLPAIVGCAAATTAVADGAMVELDVTSGNLRVLH